MTVQIQFIEIILYVSDQATSRRFYELLLRLPPAVDVPGMTAFELSAHCLLGLMPNKGIAKILADKMPHPETGTGIPRCELYLHVADLAFEYDHAVQCGAKVILPIIAMDWGDRVCYFADPDGHIIAFATSIH